MKSLLIKFSLVFLCLGIIRCKNSGNTKYIGVYYGKSLKDTVLLIRENGTGYSYKTVTSPYVSIPRGEFKWSENPESKYHSITINWINLNYVTQAMTPNLLKSVMLGYYLNVNDNFKSKLFFYYYDHKEGKFQLGIYGTQILQP